MTTNVTDERLCWLAIRDQLNKKAGKLGVFGWITVLGGAREHRSGSNARLGRDARSGVRADKMGDYAIAVDDAAQRLSPEERKHLRATREVPEWFLPEVERLAEAERKKR